METEIQPAASASADTDLQRADASADSPSTEITPTEAQPMDPKLRFRCRHIFADGHRCGSPALRREPFCYYHHTGRRPAPGPGKFRHLDAAEPFTLPIVEDRASALLVASLILSRVASNDLDPTRAARIISSLRAAISVLPGGPRSTSSALPPIPAPTPQRDLVEDLILDETHGSIAPIAEIPTPEIELALDPPLKPSRDYTDEENNYLFLAVSTGIASVHGRPASFTDQEIQTHASARCKLYGRPPIKIVFPDPVSLPGPKETAPEILRLTAE